jgi:hypothetical protein
MTCQHCKRTLKGFIWQVWGNITWWLTLGYGCQLFLRNNRSIIGCWLVSQYGYARNPYWPSKSERKHCECKKVRSEKQKLTKGGGRERGVHG